VLISFLDHIAPACAAVVAALGTWLVLQYARRRLIDLPNARSSHTVATPRGGGLGMVAGIVAGALAGPGDTSALFLVLAVLTLAAVGWWDDHTGLSARLRLCVQFGIAGLVVLLIPPDAALGWGPWIVALPHPLIPLIAALGVVWMVNLTNFMDGIDGLAGFQGLIGCLATAGMLPEGSTRNLLFVTATACLGFLCFNWPPARIFMGDVGSTALGLIFGIGVLEVVRVGIPLDLALLPVMPFVADATCTLVRRAWARERLSSPHRTHLYQRLAKAWNGHQPVTLLYGGLALVGSGLAFAEMHHAFPRGLGMPAWLSLYAMLVAYGRKWLVQEPAKPI